MAVRQCLPCCAWKLIPPPQFFFLYCRFKVPSWFSFSYKSWGLRFLVICVAFLWILFHSSYIAFTTSAVPKSEYKIQCKILSAFWSKRIKTIIRVFKRKYSACLSHDTMLKLNNIPFTAIATPVDSGEVPPLCLHFDRNMCGFNPTSSGSCLFSVLCCSKFTV